MRTKSDTHNRPEKVELLPSKRSARLKDLAAIANLCYPNEDSRLRQLEKSTETHPPDRETLEEIRKRLSEERQSDLQKEKLRNPARYRDEKRYRRWLDEAMADEAKYARYWAANAKRSDDDPEHAFDHGASDRYWQNAQPTASQTATLAGVAGELQARFLAAAKRATADLWPELWEDEPMAPEVLRPFRNMLRAFWRENDKRNRDWHVYQAHIFYWRFMVQRRQRPQLREAQERLFAAETRSEREAAFTSLSSLYAESDRVFSNPPGNSPFEEALFKLPKLKPSHAPSICKNPECSHRYFFKSKAQRVYCSPKCFREHKNAKALIEWNNKYAEQRRKQRG